MKLGEKIKLLRTERGLTQPELADKAGIEQSYLSKLENVKAVPSFDIINRVSMALETTGMELIDSLSQAYVEEHLSHIPEVAAEYAVIKQKREATMKKRFITAAAVIVLGIGIFLVGYENLLFPEVGYNYVSEGVVKDGEPLELFSKHLVGGENSEAAKIRIKNNRDRYDKKYLVTYNKINQFVEKVDGGQRLYLLQRDSNRTLVKAEFNNVENREC